MTLTGCHSINECGRAAKKHVLEVGSPPPNNFLQEMLLSHIPILFVHGYSFLFRVELSERSRQNMDKNSTPELAKENLGPALLVVAWVFAGISLVVILVRTYVRLRIVKGFHLDDWLILLTFVRTTTEMAISQLTLLGLSSRRQHILHTIRSLGLRTTCTIS